MDLIKDLRALRKEKSKLDSAKAQLRKRSKDSIARPKWQWKQSGFSKDPRMQSNIKENP